MLKNMYDRFRYNLEPDIQKTAQKFYGVQFYCIFRVLTVQSASIPKTIYEMKDTISYPSIVEYIFRTGDVLVSTPNDEAVYKFYHTSLKHFLWPLTNF